MFEESAKSGLAFPGSMELCFVSVKTSEPLVFRMTTESTSNATIWCDDMDTTAELVQELCMKLGVWPHAVYSPCDSTPSLLASLSLS